jgi:type I restriction enzyme S subunit
VLPAWTAYVALSWVGKNLETQGYGGTKVQLSLDDVANLLLTVPPLHEQTAIAAFLDRETAKIDALMAEQDKLLTLLAEKRQATISQAVTKGLDPDVPMKDSGVEWLGEVPAHWKISRLKFVASVQTVAKGKDYTGKNTTEVAYLRVANVQDGYLALDDIATIVIPIEDLARYRLQPGDVLMNEGGDFDKLGRGHIWNGEIESCIHQNHVFAVRPRQVSSAWVNKITSSDYAQFYFMTRSKQSTNLASISSTNVMELPLLLPPEAEQEAILMFVDAETARLDALAAEATRAIALLKERRSALSPPLSPVRST